MVMVTGFDGSGGIGGRRFLRAGEGVWRGCIHALAYWDARRASSSWEAGRWKSWREVVAGSHGVSLWREPHRGSWAGWCQKKLPSTDGLRMVFGGCGVFGRLTTKVCVDIWRAGRWRCFLRASRACFCSRRAHEPLSENVFKADAREGSGWQKTPRAVKLAMRQSARGLCPYEIVWETVWEIETLRASYKACKECSPLRPGFPYTFRYLDSQGRHRTLRWPQASSLPQRWP